MSERISNSSCSGVCLREVRATDLPTLFAHQADPETCRMAVVNPRDEAAFDAHWAKILSDPSNIARVIVADGALVGQISCFKLEGQDAVGYWIGREHWGRGYATRGLALLLEAVEIRPLHARAARWDVGSIRVLEKCGFVLTGYQHMPASERFPECEEAFLMLA